MTKLIAHRALMYGPDRTLENHPKQIELALSQGFECEIDLWVHENQLYLGHDEPTYQTDEGFLRQPGFWIHAKNLEALHWLTFTNLNYFWHQNDDFTLTSHGYIWTFPGKELTDKSVAVLPEIYDPSLSKLNLKCFGICSDFVIDIAKKIN